MMLINREANFCLVDNHFTLAYKENVMSVNNSSCPVFLPDNLDIDIILPDGKYRPVKTHNLKAAIYYILSSLINMSNTRKWKDYFEDNGGYPLHAPTLNNLLGKRYTEAIKILKDNKVIEVSDGYQVGKISKLYRLCEPYSSANITIKNIPIEATGILAKIQHNYNNQILENQKELDKIPFITKWFDTSRLSISLDTSHTFIEYYRAELYGLIPTTLPNGRSREEIESRIKQRINNMIDSVESFKRGDMRLTKTGKDRRLHSLLSNTKKELRTIYTFDGKPLVSVDIKSSQPYLLYYLMNPQFWKKEIKHLLPELYTDNPTDIQSILSHILMLVTFDDTKPKTNSFNQVDWTDDFYSYLVNKAKEVGEQKLFPNRNTTKRKMMMILYDDAKRSDKDKSFLFFKKLFPMEAELIKYFKELTRKKKATMNKDDNPKEISNYLPILLQRLESKLVLEHICKTISDLLPDAPLLPVHDCIYTTPEYADRVKDIMSAQLEKITGIEPGLKLEVSDKEKTLRELGLLAKEDMIEILEKKTKNPYFVNTKTPILVDVPKLGTDWLVSERYINSDYREDIDTNEKLFLIVDDTIKVS